MSETRVEIQLTTTGDSYCYYYFSTVPRIGDSISMQGLGIRGIVSDVLWLIPDFDDPENSSLDSNSDCSDYVVVFLTPNEKTDVSSDRANE